MARPGRSRGVIATVAFALVTAVVPGPAAAAAPEPDVAPLEARWSELVQAHPGLMAASVETQALVGAADRRADDTARDVVWVQAAVDEAHARLAAATVQRDRAASRRRSVARRLAEARTDLEDLRDRIDAHAATIYKHGPPALGPIESLLRSDSPADYVLRHRMSHAVLVEDDASFRRGADVVDRADARHRHAVGRASLAQAALETARDDLRGLLELIEAMRSQQRSAERSAASSRVRLDEARSVESRNLSAIVELEGQVGSADAPAGAALVARRAGSLERASADLADRYPYLDRPRRPAPASSPPVAGYRCPVEGGRFTNDWGFPRPGGRSHEGTDVFAATGTTLHAVASGWVVEIDRHDAHLSGGIAGDLGGLTVSIERASGERWYYAHLDGIADGLEIGTAVTAGQILGTVGDSGNARGGEPHLHLGRYWQDIPVNPYPSLVLACR